MARLPGDPGVFRWLKFAAGFRLPAENLDWVKHELTDAGWRGRTVLRHLAVIIPICAVVAAVLLLTIARSRVVRSHDGRANPLRQRLHRRRVRRRHPGNPAPAARP